MKPRRRYVVRTPPRPPGEALAEAAGQREMLAVREVVHAFLNADRPQEALQFALDRVAPVVGASLASVYLVDGASELMRLVAAHNWPDRLRPWLADVRVRVGFGPSGEAASERRVIEVPDIFADPDLEDWQDVARELGFRALVALPLQVGPVVLGAVAFYFADWEEFTPERRGLLRLVADLMAAAAEKSRLLDRVRRGEAAAVEALTELDRQYVAVATARREGRAFVDRAAAVLRPALDALGGGPEVVAARTVIDDLVLLADIEEGVAAVAAEAFDPRVPLREALHDIAPEGAGLPVVAEEPPHELPPFRSDREKVTLLLARLLARAVRHRGTEVRVALRVVGAHAEYRMPGRAGDDLGWQLAEAVADLLGGAVEAIAADGVETVVVSLPLEARGGAGPMNRRA
ncbi:MAG TPA: GAF domain-containing protein [Gemmatimonadaceae bacterium]|nr:GAF domain-containing protein [Gemmatimonadaceae bacterium]